MPRGMQSYLKSTVNLGTEIRMMRKVNTQLAYLIVEGEADEKFFKNLVNLSACRIYPIKGKDRVLLAMETINKQEIKGVMAIVDSDFDEILEKNITTQNVLVTDTHDIETLILKTDTVDKILNEYGNYEKIVGLEQRKVNDLIEKILKISEIIGKLRLISQRKKINLNFQELEYDKFIDINLELDYKELVRQVACNSGKYKNAEIILYEEYLEEEIKIEQNRWKICCGHDITNILAMILSERGYGNDSAKFINGTKLESALRLGYNYSKFFTTELYSSIIDWQGQYKWNFFRNNKVQVA